ASLSGDTGVIHVVEKEEDLEWALSTGPHPPYMILLDGNLFSRDILMQLRGNSRISGLAVAAASPAPSPGFSPGLKCPNDGFGVYSEDYGPQFAHCNGSVWNPLGSGLSYEDFPFPIFLLEDANETEVIKECFRAHNLPGPGSVPSFPLCAMQLLSHMHAAASTVTCMRRSSLQSTFSINPEIVCDPLLDYNVWSSLQPINASGKLEPGQQLILAATRVRPPGKTPGKPRENPGIASPEQNSQVFGWHQFLGETLSEFPGLHLPRNVLFAFFQGETFDYIGSSRMVFDMEQEKFPLRLENIGAFLELGQVALRNDSVLWMHTDPVSRQNQSVELQVNSHWEPHPKNPEMIPNSQFQAFPNQNSGISNGFHLFPRGFHPETLAFLAGSPHSQYFQSLYDTAGNIGIRYPEGLTPEEQLEFVTDTAKALAQVATLVARALFVLAGGTEGTESIRADPRTVTRLLYGFLINSNNSWFQSIIKPDLKGILGEEMP
ncbi:NICA protein, partial [Lanius ludovicianus]|nr:NICA protein [Lanius ludovicianus]